MKRILSAAVALVLAAIPVTGCRSRELAELEGASAVPPGYVAVFGRSAAGKIAVAGTPALAERRFPPCSTFKIVSTLMGLDSGVLAGLETRLGYDGTKYEIAAWNRDVTLLEAFRASCVPYYKKLTGKLDRGYVRETLERLGYGNCDISVWNSNGHNVFWIESSLLISPVEQLGVLERIFSGGSGFRPEHVALLEECMDSGRAGAWRVCGKTGTGRNHNTNRLEAWFAGFAEDAAGGRLFFAAHGADPDRDVGSGEMREWIRNLLASRTF